MTRGFWLAGCLAGLCCVLFTGTPAFAHAFLEKANPAVGAIIKVMPTAVMITFSEELEPQFSSIQVQDASAARVDRGDSHGEPEDAKTLKVDLKPLLLGRYKVIWHATSVDTHRTSGTYYFTLTR